MAARRLISHVAIAVALALAARPSSAGLFDLVVVAPDGIALATHGRCRFGAAHPSARLLPVVTIPCQPGGRPGGELLRGAPLEAGGP